MRRWLAIGLVGAWSVAASVTACGSDEGGQHGPLPDAGSENVDDGAAPNGVEIVAANLTVYTGSRASIDASQTNATEFAWTVKSAPQGSTVTTQSLTGGSTARPSFVADVSGDYVLELTARVNGQSATKSVTVKAVAAPIFFMQTSFTENPPYFEYRTIGTDKSGSRPIACRIVAPSSDGGDAGDDDDGQGQFLFQSLVLADFGLDWWEAPPGNASRVAFTTLQFFPDGGKDAFLALGTSESTCATAPAVVRHLAEDGGVSDELFVQPRFSPNGSRVAFVENKLAGFFVGTVSYDGNDRREIASVCPTEDDSCWAPALFPPRPQWLDALTFGWARSKEVDGGGAEWEIIVANDSANPNPRVYMTCSGAVPRSIAFLPGGSVIANSAAEDTEIEDLLVLEPSAPGGACRVVRNLTNFTTSRSYARDFAVSPDGTEVVFVRRVQPPDAGPPDDSDLSVGGELYVVPVNGASPPAPFGGSPEAAMFGGRYVASGSQIAWNGVIADDGGTTDPVEIRDGGAAPALRIGPRDGTRISTLVASDLDAGVFVVGGGNGGACAFDLVCSLSQSPLSAGTPVAMATAALAFAIRRRRRRSS